MSENKCKCDLCKMHRKIKAVIEKKDYQEMADLIFELDELWENAEFDRDYYKCIIDGCWPQATEILTKSLIKAKEFKENNNGT